LFTPIAQYLPFHARTQLAQRNARKVDDIDNAKPGPALTSYGHCSFKLGMIQGCRIDIDKNAPELFHHDLLALMKTLRQSVVA
jgi:hypothetical protein